MYNVTGGQKNRPLHTDAVNGRKMRSQNVDGQRGVIIFIVYNSNLLQNVFCETL